MNAEWAKEIQAKEVKRNFEYACINVGVIFEGNFINLDMATVINPHFQYDTNSRNLLLEAKDDSRVTFWRSIDNENVILSNEKKNELYELLKVTYFMKFAESRQAIDNL